MNRKAIGDRAESLACRYLTRQGMQLLTRNFGHESTSENTGCNRLHSRYNFAPSVPTPGKIR